MFAKFFSYFKKAINIIKIQGLSRGTRTVMLKIRRKNQNNLTKKNINKFYDFLLLENREAKLKYEDKKKLRLAWFIPDFGIGSGGHLNIFRIVYLLEKHSVESDIYICGSSQWGDADSVKEIISKYFFPLSTNIFIIEDVNKVNELEKSYDIALATSWQSAYYVRSFDMCVKKVYFVQDFEPFFYAMGSAYSFAERTYQFGFYGLTAGDWLKELLSKEYKMKCESFSFSFEKDLYKPHGKRDKDIQRVFFYSRPPTDRRGFELGVLALSEFCKKNPDVEIVMAGWDVSEYDIPFKHFNAGIVKIDELSHLYSQCDAALILSFTNLSLLPLELMASGCPVIINRGKNNDWIDPEHNIFIYVDDEINEIATVLDKVLRDKKVGEKALENAQELLKNSSWEKETEKIHKYMKTILEE